MNHRDFIKSSKASSTIPVIWYLTCDDNNVPGRISYFTSSALEDVCVYKIFSFYKMFIHRAA